MIRRFSVRVTKAHLVVAAVLIAAVAFLNWPVWLRAAVGVTIVVVAMVTFDERRTSDWLRAIVRVRRRGGPPVLSAEACGSVAMPGEDVAIRWDGDVLVGLVALHPRRFTPTYVDVRSGRTLHDDSLSTELINQLLSRLDVPASADVVSAGWRVGRRAPLTVYGLYEQMIGAEPCPAMRRSWLLVRVDPAQALEAANRRGGGIEGVARATVAAATRLAEGLSKYGVDARAASSFADFDQLTHVDVETETWSHLRGGGFYTTVFSAPGGPDQWWSVRADRTMTRIRLSPGTAPRSTVALTTVAQLKLDPVGWTRLRGGQLAGLVGATPLTDSHWTVPVGSAGMLVGTDPDDDHTRIYLPLDTVDSVLHVADPMVTVQVALRSAACGAEIWLPSDPAWARIATAVAASTGGPGAHLLWPTGVRTWLVSKRSAHVVQFVDHEIATEQGRIPVRWIQPREEMGLATR